MNRLHLHKLLPFLMLCLLSVFAHSEAISLFGTPSTKNTSAALAPKAKFLTADQAFTLQTDYKNQELHLKFTVQPNYYLYKERFKFSVQEGNVILGQAFFDQDPDWKDDAEFGRVQVFHQSVNVTLPVKGNGIIQIRWQGCADAGLCYAPQEYTLPVNASVIKTPFVTEEKPAKKEISISIPTLTPLVSYVVEEDIVTPPPIASPKNTEPLPPTPPQPAKTNLAQTIPNTLFSPHINLSDTPLLALLALYMLGIGLAFTPCVLPMLPIVANLVARQHAKNAKQGFFLAFAYAVGVACSYGLLGVLVSLFGSQANIAAWLQHPSVLLSASALFLLLALASFDVFHLQLPQRWQQGLQQLSQTGKAGSFIGTWLAGFFSAFIVSPCISAPLAGVLLSVATLGKPLLGGIALFILGIGLSTPLMILGASEGKLLPKSGLWLNRVKQVFGVLLLMVATVLLSRVITGSSILFIWAALCVGSGFWLNQWGGKWRIVWRSSAYMLLIWGALLLIGAALGASDPIKPLSYFNRPMVANSNIVTANNALIVKTIHSLPELEDNLRLAQANKQKVLVDFYADWCVSCKIMQQRIFEQGDVQQRLQGWLLLKADVTQNTLQERTLQQHLTVFGPPALLFFEDGHEISQSRLVGEVDKATFIAHLQQYAP